MSKRPKSIVGPTKEIDRRIRGIGRIRVPSGLPDGAQWRAMNDMVTLLASDENGRDYLREVFADRLSMETLRTHHKNGTLHLIPRGAAATGELVAALRQWREDTKANVAVDTYRTRNELLTGVASVVKAGAPVSALPDALRMLSVRMKGARQFNYVRDYARAFLRDTVGKRSPIYLAVVDVPRRPVKAKVTKHPLSPRDVLKIAAAFDVVRARRIAASTAKRGVRPIEATGADTIAMALTGMNPKEYAGAWKVWDHHVHIDGTKQDGRVRDIPKLFPTALWPHKDLPRPSVGPKNYWRWFREAAAVAGIPCTPYDLRRTFSNWMEAARIERSRRIQYMGHGAKDTTDRYERHEVTAYLIRDGKQLRHWIAAQLPKRSRISRKSPRTRGPT